MPIRRIMLALGVVLVVLGVFVTILRAPGTLSSARPFDFDINWVSAHRLFEGRQLYDSAGSRAEAEALLGPSMRDTYRGPFTSFIGLPVVALLHAPLALLEHDDALALFRLLSAVGMVAALALVARTLTPGFRLAGFAVGFGALLLNEAALWTLGIGQANALVMLGFAVAIWASERERWRLAGIGVGVAAALKLSPALFLVYFALRGKWRAGTLGRGNRPRALGGIRRGRTAAAISSSGSSRCFRRCPRGRCTRGTSRSSCGWRGWSPVPAIWG